ncbi:hypothetical protein HAL07_10870 [Helicobacter ailurogastricus]|uniref:Uncharacterized protein n=1 Tax=Helicobacter ailurogastricus TaxID=1578720 RepID=A0A0K2Y2S6_9HELI|nr:hypothetical protein HAL07_10870 [Helicobacter ailurogastricus]
MGWVGAVSAICQIHIPKGFLGVVSCVGCGLLSGSVNTH